MARGGNGASSSRRGGSLALGLALLAAIVVMANIVAARHHVRSDWTPEGLYTLSPRTRAGLGRVREPVRVTVFMVPPDRFTASAHHEVGELLTRFASASSRLKVERIDVDADPGRVEVLARRYGVPRRDLRDGVVVFACGDRARHVRVAGLARFEGKRLVAFDGEAALLSALIVVTGERRETVCFTAGHGEADSASFEPGGYGHFADEVRRAGFRSRALEPRELERGSQACRVLVVGGPTRGFGAGELAALGAQLDRGGGLLLLLGPVLDRGVTRYGRTGLEDWLGRRGVELPATVVVDPTELPGEQRYLSWGTRAGYDPVHRITRSLAGRLTIWRLARQVRLQPAAAGRRAGASVLVRSGNKGWGETDLRSLRGERPLRFDAAVDSPGPVGVAVALRSGKRGGRLVVIGSERAVLNRRIEDGRDHSRDLVLNALSWTAGQDRLVALGPKRPEQLRLSIDQRGLTRVFLLSVVALPAIALFLALFVWRRRR